MPCHARGEVMWRIPRHAAESSTAQPMRATSAAACTHDDAADGGGGCLEASWASGLYVAGVACSWQRCAWLCAGIVWSCERCDMSVHATKPCSGLAKEPEHFICWRCNHRRKPAGQVRHPPMHTCTTRLAQAQAQALPSWPHAMCGQQRQQPCLHMYVHMDVIVQPQPQPQVAPRGPCLGAAPRGCHWAYVSGPSLALRTHALPPSQSCVWMRACVCD